MMQNTTRAPSARDFCRVLLRHRWKAGFVFAVTVFVTLGGMLATPKYYESETKLFVRLGRESVGIDPTATTGGEMISLSYSRESEIHSVANLLQSRVMFEQAVDRLGVDVVLEEDLADGPLQTLRAWLPQTGDVDPQIRRERAISKMMDSTIVDNPKKSHVFAIAYKARSPERAQKILQTFLGVCLERYVDAHRNPNSREFFVKQTDLLRQQVLQVTQELRDAKNEVGLVSIDSQRKILEDNTSNLDRERVTIQAALAATLNGITTLRQRVSDDFDLVVSSGLSTRAIDDMRALLYSLQIQEREFLSKYTAAHPRTQAIRDQVEQAQKLLDRQELRIQLSNKATQEAKFASLQSQRDAAREKLRSLNKDEVRLAELERRLEQLTTSYGTYMTNLEQARIDQELGNGQITNISVVQTPSFVAKPLNRHRRAILAAGLFVALLGGFGVAFLAEYFSDSVETPWDVESRLGLPVLLSVPQSSDHPASAL